MSDGNNTGLIAIESTKYSIYFIVHVNTFLRPLDAFVDIPLG